MQKLSGCFKSEKKVLRKRIWENEWKGNYFQCELTCLLQIVTVGDITTVHTMQLARLEFNSKSVRVFLQFYIFRHLVVFQDL